MHLCVQDLLRVLFGFDIKDVREFGVWARKECSYSFSCFFECRWLDVYALRHVLVFFCYVRYCFF